MCDGGSLISDCGLQIADFRLQIADSDCGVKLQIAHSDLR